MRNVQRIYRHKALILAVLGLLLLRAYVPAGFMPASGHPFLVEICPVGLSLAAMPGHHHHHGAGSMPAGEECPFGSAPAAGPVSTMVPFCAAAAVGTEPGMVVAHALPALRRESAHQPRAPPALV